MHFLFSIREVQAPVVFLLGLVGVFGRSEPRCEGCYLLDGQSKGESVLSCLFEHDWIFSGLNELRVHFHEFVLWQCRCPFSKNADAIGRHLCDLAGGCALLILVDKWFASCEQTQAQRP